MKPSIVFVLISAAMLESCQSYYARTEEDQAKGKPTESEPVVVRLNDGSSIECAGYYHGTASAEDDFIYGSGEMMNENGVGTVFRGKIMRSQIDSSAIDSSGNWRDLECWLSDGSRVTFRESKYVVITPDKGASLWCIGDRTEQNGKYHFSGRVASANIQEIQIEKYSGDKTFWLIAGILVPVTVAVVWLAQGLSHID